SGLHPRPNLFTPILVNESGGPNVCATIKRYITQVGENTITYQVPVDILLYFRELSIEATAVAELPEDICVGGYTVDEFRRIFRSLYRRAAVHQNYCWASSIRGMAMGSIAMELTLTDMLRDGRSERVEDGITRHVISDLTYD